MCKLCVWLLIALLAVITFVVYAALIVASKEDNWTSTD